MNALSPNSFSVAWREPFGLQGGKDASGVYRDLRGFGQTIAEIVATVPGLRADFATRGTVMINGEPVPRHLWGHVRPKPSRPECPVAVTLHMALGRGGGGGKQVIAVVAAIAVTVLSAGAASGTLGPALGLGSGFAAGTIGAQLLAAGIAIAGSLAIAALTPPPSLGALGATSPNGAADTKQAASISGNMLEAGAPIPRVVGTMKIFPPFACEPVVSIVGDDQYVDAIFCMAGPHRLDDIRVSGSAIAVAENIEYETREGWEDDAPLILITRQGKTVTPNIELTTVAVDPANTAANTLAHQGAPSIDLPIWHGVTSRAAPDELQIHIAVDGPYDLDNFNAPTLVPLRIRFRRKGATTWINGPEFHVSGKKPGQYWASIGLVWQAAPSLPLPPTDRGIVYAFKSVPAQSIAPAMGGWTADSYFSGGAGNDLLSNSTFVTSNVRNVALAADGITLYLDPASFPQDRYEVQLMSGAAVLSSHFTPSTYATSGTIKDLFGYWNDAPTLRPAEAQNKGRKVTVARVISLWNEHPIATTGLALLAIRAKNQSVSDVSILASGYVRDWDGSDWTDWTTTSNPAPHYRDILSGAANIDPLPDDLRDDAGLLAWRSDCADNGYACDFIAEGGRIEDTLSILASCGYARPYESEIWGVTMDRDMAGDPPVQVFTPRNMAGFRWERAFARLPNGFRVNFKDASDDYNDNQVIVYAEGYSGGPDGRLEDVTYDGVTDETRARTRAAFDLAQADLRATFYYGDAAFEHVVARKGDLVGIQHDTLSRVAAAARIRAVTVEAGEITEIELDSEIGIVNEPDMLAVADMLAVPDMLNVGIQSGIMIRRADGTISTHALADATGATRTVTLETPVADTTVEVTTAEGPETYPAIGEGCLAAFGAVSQEYVRLIVSDVKPGGDFGASLTFVDEAPGLVRF